MKSPLYKRLPRELREEVGKYLVVFLLMVATIGFVSGFLVADGSMLKAYNDGFSKYNIENGNFRTKERIYQGQRQEIEKNGIKIYENFYIEESVENGSTMRFFKNRKEVNKVCLMKGQIPEKSDEMAIDRMYADNNQLSVGDTLKSGGKTWKITGLVALPDYSCLFQNNSDTMFDAVKFGVAIVSDSGFATLNQKACQYDYSWLYKKQPENETTEKEVSEDLMEAVGKEVTLESFVPRYQNQAINFTGEDMGSDRAMMLVLLYIVMAIMAFVFAVMVSNTIRKEAGVIGTLRASGYTREELIHHYMVLPVCVTLIGALIGNILGYTVLKNVCAGMYYGSYSLPTYVTIWNGEAFVLTTVFPVLIMLVINYAVLRHKLKLSPLQFLRRDLSGKKKKKAIYLNPKRSIFHRYRMRIIFQNKSNYLVLFVGIIFANLLLFFGLLLPSVLDHYKKEIQNGMLAEYQYILEPPMSAVSGNELERLFSVLEFSAGTKTDNADAEPFSAYNLQTVPGKYKTEEILLYGVEPDSKYIHISAKNGVYISSAYADKFQIHKGDTIKLKEKYEKDTYTFKVEGIYNYSGALCVFMDQSKLNQTFDLGTDYYSGYFSKTKITDIDEKYIGSVVDLNALTKVSRQLNVSMGSMMGLVNGFAVVIFLVLIYLLSKIIIEKNAQAISMAKILGYNNGEIARLYILSTSIVVVVCLLVSFPIETWLMKIVFREMMLASLTGWITLWIDPVIYVEMFVIGVAAYAIVAAVEYRRIQKVPMEEALKNVE